MLHVAKRPARRPSRRWAWSGDGVAQPQHLVRGMPYYMQSYNIIALNYLYWGQGYLALGRIRAFQPPQSIVEAERAFSQQISSSILLHLWSRPFAIILYRQSRPDEVTRIKYGNRHDHPKI